MKHLRNFNESDEIHMGEDQFQPEETRMEDEPRFTLKQLEAAFMSARVINGGKDGSEPRFKNFKHWFTSELGSSNMDVVPNYQFRDQSKFPF